MSIAAEIAKLVGWEHWHQFDDGPLYPAIGPVHPPLDPKCDFSPWRPDIDLNHAIQAAELRFSDLFLFTMPAGDYLAIGGAEARSARDARDTFAGRGTSLCAAVVEAIRKAGAKEAEIRAEERQLDEEPPQDTP